MSEKELNALREEINKIDTELFELVAARLEVNHKIGLLKKAHEAPVVNSSREDEIFSTLKSKSEQRGINPELSTKLWKLLINESHRIQHNC